MTLVDLPFGTFTNEELARLAVYKAAVAAGFYTDSLSGPHERDEPGQPAAESQNETAEQKAR